jgi:hypothetical protein
MKNLILTLTTLMTANLYAHDTSGCYMRETSKTAKTAFGHSLQVTSSMSLNSSCWNAESSSVTIAYGWVQDSDDDSHSVTIWANINGNAKTLNPQVRCLRDQRISYSKDTTNTGSYLCTATAVVQIGYQQGVSVEVAPQIDGSWDTRGYAQNYSFEL